MNRRVVLPRTFLMEIASLELQHSSSFSDSLINCRMVVSVGGDVLVPLETRLGRNGQDSQGCRIHNIVKVNAGVQPKRSFVRDAVIGKTTYSLTGTLIRSFRLCASDCFPSSPSTCCIAPSKPHSFSLVLDRLHLAGGQARVGLRSVRPLHVATARAATLLRMFLKATGWHSCMELCC